MEINSIHLFFLFPRLEEGGLATFRAALVQNQHLTVLAQVCEFDRPESLINEISIFKVMFLSIVLISL